MAKNPKKYHLRMKYDFGVDGGAHAAANHIALATNATIPDNAIVDCVTMYTSTDVAGSSSTLGFIIGEAANTTYDVAVTAATIAEATFADESVVVDTTGGKAKAASVLKLDVGTADLTAGVIEVFLSYYVGYAE
tara:strand:+ start:1181 stop:1582 length:402 start_codon:yes stop_codon:yes gene_type:complete